MGVRGLSNRIDEQKVDSYYDLMLNDETSRYVFRILAVKEIMENREKYGYEIPEHRLYKQESLQQVLVEQNIRVCRLYIQESWVMACFPLTSPCNMEGY